MLVFFMNPDKLEIVIRSAKQEAEMINIECLNEVSQGLTLLMEKFQKNSTEGDLRRLSATIQAHRALRRVILTMEIKGDILNISPLRRGNKYGWVVTDSFRKIKFYSQ